MPNNDILKNILNQEIQARPIRISLSSFEENHCYAGYVSQREGEVVISYLGEDQEPIEILIKENGVTILRKSGNMNFSKDQETAVHFQTPQGTLVFRVLTKEMFINAKGFEIEYSLSDEYGNLAYENHLKVEYTKE